MNKLKRTVLLWLVLCASASYVVAQTTANPTTTAADPNRAETQQQQQQPPPASRVATPAGTDLDENFELNIDLRHITERDYEASTAVEIGDAEGRGVNLQIGVAVAASRIDVLLRNIRGRVRFRATLDPVLQRINARRAGAVVDSATPVAPPE